MMDNTSNHKVRLRQYPNTFVRLRRDPTCAGILLEGDKTVAGSRMVQVRLADGQVKWLPSSALEPVPSAPETLIDRFAGGKFVEPNWLRRTLTRLRVTGRLSDVVYSMEATETEFYAYQFKPVIKLMNSPTDSMLVADEVGLGKTIEAGLVWTELRARLDSDRLLVACPKTLCQEMAGRACSPVSASKRRLEMRESFSERFAERGRQDEAMHLICSMQGLRPPRGWEDDPDEGERQAAFPLDMSLRGSSMKGVTGSPSSTCSWSTRPITCVTPTLCSIGSAGSRTPLRATGCSSRQTPIHLRNRDLHSVLRMVDPGHLRVRGHARGADRDQRSGDRHPRSAAASRFLHRGHRGRCSTKRRTTTSCAQAGRSPRFAAS